MSNKVSIGGQIQAVGRAIKALRALRPALSPSARELEEKHLNAAMNTLLFVCNNREAFIKLVKENGGEA